MVLTMMLAASSFPVGAAITNELPPALLMFMRFLFAAILFGPYVFIKNKHALPGWKSIFSYAMLSAPLAVFFWCMFESLRYTSVLNTGALYTLVPAITAVYALFINGELIGKYRSFGLILGTLGALWIVFRGDINALINLQLNYGDLIFTVGCLFLGLYNPLTRRIYDGEPVEVMTFWVLLSGAGWLLLASGEKILTTDWTAVKLGVYGGVLYLSIFTTLMTFFLVQICVVRIGALKVGAYGFLAPVFVILFSIISGMEQFELIWMPGILLVLLAMLIIQQETELDSRKTHDSQGHI